MRRRGRLGRLSRASRLRGHHAWAEPGLPQAVPCAGWRCRCPGRWPLAAASAESGVVAPGSTSSRLPPTAASKRGGRSGGTFAAPSGRHAFLPALPSSRLPAKHPKHPSHASLDCPPGYRPPSSRQVARPRLPQHQALLRAFDVAHGVLHLAESGGELGLPYQVQTPDVCISPFATRLARGTTPKGLATPSHPNVGSSALARRTNQRQAGGNYSCRRSSALPRATVTTTQPHGKANHTWESHAPISHRCSMALAKASC